MLRPINGGGDGPHDIGSGEEEASDVVVVKEVDEKDWNLNGVMTAAEADECGLQGKFREFQSEYRAVRAIVFVNSVIVVQNG